MCVRLRGEDVKSNGFSLMQTNNAQPCQPNNTLSRKFKAWAGALRRYIPYICTVGM